MTNQMDLFWIFFFFLIFFIGLFFVFEQSSKEVEEKTEDSLMY